MSTDAGANWCTCNQGYTGNGTTCTGVGSCATKNGGCAATAKCTSTPTGPTCMCNTGYTGSGTVCTAVNSCLTTANGGCDAHASCTSTGPGTNTCMSELALRREAVGRKNWLFVGSDDGGAVNALFSSLLASCRLCGVEPWSYLRDVFCLLPRWPQHRLLELAPLNWNQTRVRGDAQTLLEQNPFRKLTLDARG